MGRGNYVRADTITAANARLVDHQRQIPLVAHWGGGQLTSADGMRFVVPVRSIHAAPNPRYFGVARGITLFNYLADNFLGWANIVITGTKRDSQFLLDRILDNPTTLDPKEIMTDTPRPATWSSGCASSSGSATRPAWPTCRLAAVPALGDRRLRRPRPAQPPPHQHQADRRALGRHVPGGRDPANQGRRRLRSQARHQRAHLWNSGYMDHAVEHLRTEGTTINDENLEHLSPLQHEHVNLHGRCHFSAPDHLRHGLLRPLATPSGR